MLSNDIILDDLCDNMEKRYYELHEPCSLFDDRIDHSVILISKYLKTPNKCSFIEDDLFNRVILQDLYVKFSKIIDKHEDKNRSSLFRRKCDKILTSLTDLKFVPFSDILPSPLKDGDKISEEEFYENFDLALKRYIMMKDVMSDIV